MNFDDRVAAVAKFGVTERQARFLTTVMLHSGLCVPRQFATFAGIAYGHKVSRFFDRLATREYAAECGCLHNRAALYHVRHQALYRAIGHPDSLYRRPVSAQHAIDRLMRLDAVISSGDLHWLGSEDEKVAFFALTTRSFLHERLPHTLVNTPPSPRLHLFPDDLPIGVSSGGRVVFVVVVPMSDGDFRACLQRHADLLRALPGWTLRLVFARDAANRVRDFETAARDELTLQLSPSSFAEFRWYCSERKPATNARVRSQADQRFARAHRAFATPRYELLYRRWLTGGDSVFELVSSTTIAEALERGTGRIESQILPLSYRHLAPLVTLHSAAEGVEEGERTSARPQPPSPPSLREPESLANH
jgi:hypothetical protein